MIKVLLIIGLSISCLFSQTAYLTGADSTLIKTTGYSVNTVILISDSADGAVDSIAFEVYDAQTGSWGLVGSFSGFANEPYAVPGDGNKRWYYSTYFHTATNFRLRRINVSGTLSRRTQVSIGSQAAF